MKIGDLVVVDPPGTCNDSGVPRCTVAQSHCTSLTQSLWWHRLLCESQAVLLTITATMIGTTTRNATTKTNGTRQNAERGGSPLVSFDHVIDPHFVTFFQQFVQDAPIKNNPLEKILYLRNCSRFFSPDLQIGRASCRERV